ncbi:hypothetical protein ACFPYI_14730 [Halomarina salina]|uniref:Uncharacterized protein n=1 Tax=Halomarina salina TaxID=1872699 RepID=A0ABD5RPZ4_9EURY|nr:hypothetical protein [Halomarina salina]
MTDDIDWHRNQSMGGKTTRVRPAIISRGHNVKDVPDALVEDIIEHTTARIVCPDCKDDSFYFIPEFGGRPQPECQGGCGNTFVLR